MQLRKMDFHKTNKVKVKKLYKIVNCREVDAEDVYKLLPNVVQNMISNNIRKFYVDGAFAKGTRVKSSLQFKLGEILHHVVKPVNWPAYMIIRDSDLEEDNEVTFKGRTT